MSSRLRGQPLALPGRAQGLGLRRLTGQGMPEEATPNSRDGWCTIVGIDEAGYGPTLGPLVVSGVVFDVPVSVMKALKSPADGPDLWKLLKASICRKPSKKDPRLAIADSKALHGRSAKTAGVQLLERAALTFLSQAGASPTGLNSLLDAVSPTTRNELPGYPWYADDDIRLPVEVSTDDLSIQRNSVERDLKATGVRFRGVFSEVLLEGGYNRLVEATRNKSNVLFMLTTRIIQRIADAAPSRPLRIWVDRQGGRTTYLRPLMTAFPHAQLEEIEQSENRSSYRMTQPSAPWMVRFCVKGEEHHLPIALASVYSKYLRELCMLKFNRYWARHVADLKPTAGYYKDAQRFLADIDGHLVQAKVDRRRLIRSR